MWDERPIEQAMQRKLDSSLGNARGQECFADYIAARRSLVEDVLQEIKASEPDLTDHGPDHVANVLTNVERLLGADIDKLEAEELYALCVCVLFHDVGNIHGRNKHNRNISDVYEKVRKGEDKYRQEKLLVLTVAGAHSGKAKDGSSDTLKDVPSTMQLKGKQVRSRPLAALLRFADELAEGPQRTSAYRLERGMYKSKSKIYHSYASGTDVCIDREGNRIALSYHFHIKAKGRVLTLAGDPSVKLKEILDFTSQRVIKMNEERQYARHYCDWLTPFKELSVNLDFWHQGHQLNTGLGPLILSGLVVPGDAAASISTYNPAYSTKHLMASVAQALRKQ